MKRKKEKLLKLDLGAGDNKKEGFIGVDIVKTKSVDIVCDLLKFPWPFKDNSVDEVYSSHFFEHIPGYLRGKWMNELYRVMKPGVYEGGVGKANGEGPRVVFIVPYYSSMRAIQDYTHQWPPLSEASFLYFNKEWRKLNKLEHYDVKCDFDFSYNYIISGQWISRSDETKFFAVSNYINAVPDLQVILVKRPQSYDKTGNNKTI